MDGGDAKRVSGDRNGTMEVRQLHLAVEDRQAGAQLAPDPEPAASGRRGGEQQKHHDRPRNAPTHNVHLNDADENAVRGQSLDS